MRMYPKEQIALTLSISSYGAERIISKIILLNYFIYNLLKGNILLEITETNLVNVLTAPDAGLCIYIEREHLEERVEKSDSPVEVRAVDDFAGTVDVATRDADERDGHVQFLAEVRSIGRLVHGPAFTTFRVYRFMLNWHVGAFPARSRASTISGWFSRL